MGAALRAGKIQRGCFLFFRHDECWRRSLVSTKITCVLDIFSKAGYKRYLGPFLHGLFQSSKRRAGFVVLTVLVITYGWVFFRGPQGLQTLLEKRREIRELEYRNDEARRENERRKEKIHRLEESRSEQEMQIRKQLKLQKQGETTFILPESEQPKLDQSKPDQPQMDPPKPDQK